MDSILFIALTGETLPHQRSSAEKHLEKTASFEPVRTLNPCETSLPEAVK